MQLNKIIILIEKKITESSELTVAELKMISNSLVSELDTFSKNSDDKNKQLEQTLTNFANQSSKAIKKSMQTMSKNPIYNKPISD